jgi:FkbM family methyltransferase
MRPWLRRSTNALLGPLGLRVVSADGGPRGPMAALRRARAHGVVPRQIVDVGASNGSWTRECLQVLPDSRYLLVDPLPANASPLAALAAQYPKVRVWQGALGRAPGARALLVHGDQSSFLPSDSFGAHAEHSVEVRTLDSFLGTELLTPPDFIKADVQGFELEVLRGASRCLETTQLLLLEVSYRRVYREQALAHEVIAFVGAEGFRIYDICTYAGRPLDGELTQSDILFARESSPLFANETWC